MTRLLLTCGALTLAILARAPAAEPPTAAGPVSYFRDVRPIFQQNCQGCHQPAKANANYVMTDFASLLKPGETAKPSIVPGKPEASYLIAEIVVTDGHHEMPKDRPPLKPTEIETVTKWVAQGATDDTPKNAAQATISATNPPKYVGPPVVTSLAYSPDGKLLAATGYHEIGRAHV